MKAILRPLGNSYVLAAGVFLCLAVVAFSLYVLNERAASAQHTQTDDQWSLIVPAITADEHLLGDADAPVQVIAYSDLSCRYCMDFFHTQYNKLRQAFGNAFVLAYRHLPLESHPRAKAEAEAAECIDQAGGEPAFWGFVRGVYADPSYEEGLSDEAMRAIAVTLPVDLELYDSCVQNESTADLVEQNAREASIAGMTATPSFVLKTGSRAIVVSGNYYGQIANGIAYLLETASSTAR